MNILRRLMTATGVACAIMLIVACFPTGDEQSMTSAPLINRNVVRLELGEAVYGREATRALIASHRDEIRLLENDSTLRDRVDNPDSLVVYLRAEVASLEARLAIPAMTVERADSLRRMVRAELTKMGDLGLSSGLINGQRTSLRQLLAADSELTDFMASNGCTGLRLESYSSVVNSRGTRLQTTQRTANAIDLAGVPIPDFAKQTVAVDLYADGNFATRETASTHTCREASLSMNRTIRVYEPVPALGCHAAFNINVAWDGSHQLWTTGGWVDYLSSGHQPVTIPENRTGCSCRGGGGGNPPVPSSSTGGCNGGGGEGTPPRDCEWVTVEMYVGGVLVRTWRVRACG